MSEQSEESSSVFSSTSDEEKGDQSSSSTSSASVGVNGDSSLTNIVKEQRKSTSSNHEDQNGDQQEEEEEEESSISNVIDEEIPSLPIDPQSFVEEDESRPVDVDVEENRDVMIDLVDSLLEKEEKIAENKFHFNTPQEEKSEESKSQRDLDEESQEIVLSIPIPIEESTPPILVIHGEEEVIDNRPLTALEDPFGIDIERRSENLSENIQEEELVIPTIELEKVSFEQIPSSHPEGEDEKDEILPPLASSSLAMETIESAEEEKGELVFDVEDVLANKSLLKQTLFVGRENSRPTRSTLVTVSYRLSLLDRETNVERLIDEVNEERFFVGECDILPSIDICVQLMNEGERVSIDSDIRHCYGEKGFEEKGIPPTSKDSSLYRMKIDLELQRWIPPPDPQTLDVNERLFWGNKKRERGNFFYRREDYSNAVECYRGALRFLDITLNPLLDLTSDVDRCRIIDRYIQVENNVGQVHLQMNRLDSCLTSVENVLRYDPMNSKALFRQGKALFQLSRYDLALQSFVKLPQHLLSNSDQQIIQTCRNKIETYQRNEKEIYKRMFQPKTTTTTTERREIEITKSSSIWWNYLALGSVSVALIAIGGIFFFKRRQMSS